MGTRIRKHCSPLRRRWLNTQALPSWNFPPGFPLRSVSFTKKQISQPAGKSVHCYDGSAAGRRLILSAVCWCLRCTMRAPVFLHKKRKPLPASKSLFVPLHHLFIINIRLGSLSLFASEYTSSHLPVLGYRTRKYPVLGQI